MVVAAGDTHGAAAVVADERDDLLVHPRAEDHLDDLHRPFVGDAQAVEALGLDTELGEGLVDLWAAAVDHHRVEADVLHQHDVLGEAVA